MTQNQKKGTWYLLPLKKIKTNLELETENLKPNLEHHIQANSAVYKPEDEQLY
jgi:hypothetical protein